MDEVSQAFQPGSRSLTAYRNAAPADDATPTDAKLAQLQPHFGDHLQDLIQDQGANGNPVGISSGYRDPVQQAALYQAALQKYGSPAVARLWVAPPGHSNHNAGLAADLSYASPAGMAAVRQAAPNYGLTFPLGNENWHIEPQGIRGQPPAAPLAAMASLAPPRAPAPAPANPGVSANLPPASAPPPSAPQAAPSPYAGLAAALANAAPQLAEQVRPQAQPQPAGVEQNFASRQRSPAEILQALTQGLAGNLTLA